MFMFWIVPQTLQTPLIRPMAIRAVQPLSGPASTKHLAGALDMLDCQPTEISTTTPGLLVVCYGLALLRGVGFREGKKEWACCGCPLLSNDFS